ncbi:hypothetical protein CYK37_28965 [Mesorhizobium loti]|nr:hypothetical protein CYK37_28965 [Mesorhizobium loti]
MKAHPVLGANGYQHRGVLVVNARFLTILRRINIATNTWLSWSDTQRNGVRKIILTNQRCHTILTRSEMV